MRAGALFDFYAAYGERLFMALLLRGNLAKSFISAFLAELRFQAPPPFLFYSACLSDIASHMPALRPDSRGFDASTFTLRMVSIGKV